MIKVQLFGLLRETAEKGTFSLQIRSSNDHVTVNDAILKLTSLFKPEFREALIDSELDDPQA